MRHLLCTLPLLLACSGDASDDTAGANDPNTGDDAGSGDAGSGDGGDDTATGTESPIETIDCAGITPTLTVLSLAEAKAMIAAEVDGQAELHVINVHIPHSKDIAGTDTAISYDDIDALDAYIGDKGAKALIYCKTGPMSEIAGEALVERGFCNLFDMPDGYKQWASAGYEMAN